MAKSTSQKAEDMVQVKPTSISTTESAPALASSRKRKSTASTTPASEKPNNSKRVKKENAPSTEPKLGKAVGKVADSIYDTIVDFKIGEDGISLGIHRGLLLRASSFFREQISTGVTTEDGIAAQEVVMKDEDPDIFRRFNLWLYSDKMISESETYKTVPWGVILEVYSFAERTGIPGLQNRCVDTIIKKRMDGALFPNQSVINRLWKMPGNAFRLRHLLLDLFATSCNLTQAIASNQSFHPKFLQGLVLALFEMKTKTTVNDQVDFWAKRQKYYVEDSQNPIMLD